MKVALFLFALTLTRAQDTTYNCNGWSQFTIGSYLVENIEVVKSLPLPPSALGLLAGQFNFLFSEGEE